MTYKYSWCSDHVALEFFLHNLPNSAASWWILNVSFVNDNKIWITKIYCISYFILRMEPPVQDQLAVQHERRHCSISPNWQIHVEFYTNTIDLCAFNYAIRVYFLPAGSICKKKRFYSFFFLNWNPNQTEIYIFAMFKCFTWYLQCTYNLTIISFFSLSLALIFNRIIFMFGILPN